MNVTSSVFQSTRTSQFVQAALGLKNELFQIHYDRQLECFSALLRCLYFRRLGWLKNLSRAP